MLEEHDGRPVVGEVLGERAGRAGSLVTEISLGRVHARVESIATHNLVKMGTGSCAGLNETCSRVSIEKKDEGRRAINHQVERLTGPDAGWSGSNIRIGERPE